jgi:hypothetical protein
MEEVTSITDVEEIINIIDKMHYINDPIKIVQEIDGTVIENFGRIENVNTNSGNFYVRPSDYDTPFDFKRRHPIHIENESKSLCFSTTVNMMCRPSLIDFYFPKFIKILKIRENKRYDFSDKNVTAKYSNFTVMDYAIGNLSLEGKIIDLSQEGMGLKVTDPRTDKFKTGDRLVFTFIGTHPISSKLSGRIEYIKVYKERNNDRCRKLGIIFDSKINLDAILKSIEDN